MTEDHAGRLPVQFAELEPFCERWDLPGYADRNARRLATPLDELATVHAALLRHGPAALDYLDARGVAGLDERDTRLARLMLALPTLGMAVEVFRSPQVPDTDGLEMRVSKEPAL